MIICSKCGRSNEDYYTFCLGCGSKIVPPGSLEEASEEAPVEGQGDTIIESSSTQEPADLNRCPQCHAQVPHGFAFCGGCGARLDTPTAKPAPLQPSTAKAMRKAKLVLILPDGSEGGELPLTEGENPVGRNVAPDVFGADQYLSPLHATFVLRGDSLTIRDEASFNGVFFRIRTEVQISSGDMIRIGQELIQFEEIARARPVFSTHSEDGTAILGSPVRNGWGRLLQVAGYGVMGRAYLLSGKETIIGREKADILFNNDGFVSSTHAKISLRDGAFYLKDLGSSNGTFLRIRQEQPLQPDDLVLVGQQLFLVELG